MVDFPFPWSCSGGKILQLDHGYNCCCSLEFLDSNSLLSVKKLLLVNKIIPVPWGTTSSSIMPQCQSVQAWSLVGVYAGAVCVQNHSCNLNSSPECWHSLQLHRNAALTTVTVQLNSENINSNFSQGQIYHFPMSNFILYKLYDIGYSVNQGLPRVEKGKFLCLHTLSQISGGALFHCCSLFMLSSKFWKCWNCRKQQYGSEQLYSKFYFNNFHQLYPTVKALYYISSSWGEEGEFNL